MRINAITALSAFSLRLFTAVLFVFLVLLLAAGCGGSTPGGSEREGAGGEYPRRDIEFMVMTTPGGGYDTWARLIAPFIEKHLPNDAGVVVRNVPGAGQLSGSTQLYATEPDGYTIGILNLTVLSAAQVTGEADYDLREYSFLGSLSREPQVVVVAEDSPADSMEDLEGAEPITLALPGPTPQPHIIHDAFDIEYDVIMHDGQSEAILSILRGDADAGVNQVESVLEELGSGELKAILFAGQEKPGPEEPGYEEIRNVQTIEEAGHPELAGSLDSVRFIAAPPGLPEDIQQILEQAIQDALADPEFQAQAEESKVTPAPLNAEETREVVNEALAVFNEYQDVLESSME